MKAQLLALASLAALAACQSKNEVDLKNASVEEVAEATKAADKLEPGLYKTTVEVVSVEIPGMPAANKAMADAMTGAMKGRKNVSESCVTKEDAEKPPAKMLGGDGDCTFETFKLGGGRLDAKMVCAPRGGPGKMAMTMNGSFGGSAYEINSESRVSGMPGPSGGEMVMKAKVSGERVGECAKTS